MKLTSKLKRLYVRYFQHCKKCGKRINPDEGFWHWYNIYPQKGGYYHTDCGQIGTTKPKGFFPF